MELNIAHSEHPQQQMGLMICGYEWGYSKEDQAKEENGEGNNFNKDAGSTFANKEVCYGPDALNWKYDNNIKKWFAMWGHPLQNPPGDFERSIIQTNWCNPSGTRGLSDEYIESFSLEMDQILQYYKSSKNLGQ